MRFDEAFELFRVQLLADGRSPHTVAQYRRQLATLAHYFGERRVDEITHVDIARFLASESATARTGGGVKKASSLNTLRSTIRTFWAYLAATRIVPGNAAHLVRRARCSPAPPRGLSPNDVARLRAELAHASEPTRRRDRALVELILGTGVRIGAALALRVEDVDLDARELVLREMKGNAPAQLRVSDDVAAILREQIGSRREGFVFEGPGGRRFSTRRAAARLQAACAKAGIRSAVSPHRLRHTFAIGLYERTRDLLAVQRALHHRSISSTVVYAGSARL